MPVRIRLTLWYTALLGAILISFSVLLYMVLAFFLYDQVDQNLRDLAAQFGRELQNSTLQLTESRLVLPEISNLSSPSVFIQVVDTEGKFVGATQNLGDVRIPYPPEIHQENLRGKALRITIHVADIPVRLYAAPIFVGSPPKKPLGAVIVGQSLESIETTLRLTALFLTGGTLAAMLLAAMIGAFLARKSFQPIDEINKTVKRIVGAQDLQQRLLMPAAMDEIGQLTVTINNMLERLHNFFQAQVRLSADVSHELRTPLTVIRGNVDLLRRGAADDPAELKETLAVIDGELDRMSRIVADLLLLSQADAGMSLRMGTVELDTILLEVYQRARVMANGVTIKLGHEDQAVVYGDADRLRQLLINLVTNALKHTPPGGSVTLSLYRDAEWVRIIVADTGRGIATTALPHIFERFYKAENNKQKGSGLGLSIAQWIARAHHGQVTVTSEQGQGSTFTLWLPLQKTHAANESHATPLTMTAR